MIVGISIPVLMILFVAASIYLSRFFVEPPAFDFLYANSDQYFVEDGELVKVEPEEESDFYPNKVRSQYPAGRLFLHDIDKNESSQISFEDAQKLNLDTGFKSPDGFEIVRGREVGFLVQAITIPNIYRGIVLAKKLDLETQDGSYFLGWVIE